MARFARVIVRFRWIVLAIVGGLSVYLCGHIPSLDVRVSADTLLPQTHPFVVASNRIEALFGGRNQVVIGIVPEHGDIYTSAILSAVHGITEDLLAVPGVIPNQVLSLTAPNAKAIRGTADGMEVSPLAGQGPFSREATRLVRERVLANPVYDRTIVSSDGTSALILADFRQGADLPNYRAIRDAVERILARHRSDETRLALGGIAISLAWLELYSAHMLWLFFVALAVVMGVLYLSFRSVQGMLIPVLTALVSAGWALGIMSLTGTPLDIANVTTPILIMAVAAGHSVQMLKRYYEELPTLGDSRRAVVVSLVKVGPVMLTAGLIAMVGFLSLLTFDIQTIRTFGLLTACGIGAAVILELTFVPALRASLPPPSRAEVERERQADRLARVTAAVAALIRRKCWGRLLVPTVLLTALLGLGAGFMTVDNSMRGNFKPESEVRRDDVLLNARMAGTNTLSLLIEGPREDSIKEPAVLRAMEATQRFLERFDQVGKTVSLVDYLDRMNQAVHGDDPAEAHLPDTRETVAQYLLLYSAGGSPHDFDALVDEGYQYAVLTAFVKTDSSAYLKPLTASVQEFVRDRFPPEYRVSVGGGITQGVALNEVIVRGKLLNMLQVAATLLVLTGLVFRSIVAGLLVMLPLGLAVLANFGVMGLFGIRLDIGTAVVAAMGVGIGADYALYLLYRFREEHRTAADLDTAITRTLVTAGSAVISVALSVGLGYAVLILSAFQFHVLMGLLVAVAMAASCAAAVVLIPLCLARWRPAGVLGETSVVTCPPVCPPDTGRRRSRRRSDDAQPKRRG